MSCRAGPMPAHPGAGLSHACRDSFRFTGPLPQMDEHEMPGSHLLLGLFALDAVTDPQSSIVGTSAFVELSRHLYWLSATQNCAPLRVIVPASAPGLRNRSVQGHFRCRTPWRTMAGTLPTGGTRLPTSLCHSTGRPAKAVVGQQQDWRGVRRVGSYTTRPRRPSWLDASESNVRMCR